jgi:hypothetical protein
VIAEQLGTKKGEDFTGFRFPISNLAKELLREAAWKV